MTSLTVFVGIDYHQDKVQLCLLDCVCSTGKDAC